MSDAASEVVVLSDLADLDKATELWAQEVGWREQLSQITKISEGIAGSRAIGQGGAELRMMILRQRSLIDRWVRQAFSEGLLARQSADERVAELEALFDTAWQADQRAIKRWREANPGNDLVSPDRADMVVWLMDELSALSRIKGDHNDEA